MLFSENLENIIFNRHEHFEPPDELIIVSGYVGPAPISKLHRLPFPTKVVYGMYKESGIHNKLHSSLIKIQNENPDVNIFYANIPVHSKCYLWKKNNKIIHALIGSANFSSSGLNSPFRELLAETTNDTFPNLLEYSKKVIDNSTLCTKLEITSVENTEETQGYTESNECKMTLLIAGGETPPASGINWGHGEKANNKKSDAYIAIRIAHLREYPDMFPPLQEIPVQLNSKGGVIRQNDSIEIIWDDGVIMEGHFASYQKKKGVRFPKYITSTPHKSEMGIYLRKRLGLEHDAYVTAEDLNKYGRTDISIMLQSKGVYYMDFSV